MLEEVPDRKVTILYPQDDAAKRALQPASALRGRYLEQELRSLTSSMVAVVPIPVLEVETDARGHPTEKGMMTIVRGLDERLSQNLFLSAELATTRRPYTEVQGLYRFGCWTCAGKEEEYPAPLEICPSCCAEMAAYDGEAKWDIFVASFAVHPPGGPPSPPGVGSPPWRGVRGVRAGDRMRRDRETRFRNVD